MEGIQQPKSVTCEEFCRILQKRLELYRINSFDRTLRSILSSIPENLKEIFHREKIIELLENRELNISINAKPGSPVDIVIDRIQTKRNEYFTEIEEKFLLLCAPLEIKESKLRKTQFESFCQIYPYLDGDDSEKRKKVIEVLNQNDLEEETQTFLLNSKEALICVIIFNGHGEENGMNVGECVIKLDEYCDAVSKTYDKLGPEECPNEVHVVFAQCYGHKFNKRPESNIKVTAFTSETKPFTYNITLEDEQKQIISSQHQELNLYAMQKVESMNETVQVEESYKHGDAEGEDQADIESEEVFFSLGDENVEADEESSTQIQNPMPTDVGPVPLKPPNPRLDSDVSLLEGSVQAIHLESDDEEKKRISVCEIDDKMDECTGSEDCDNNPNMSIEH